MDTSIFLKRNFYPLLIESLVNHTMEIIILLDSEFKIVFLNSSAEKLLNPTTKNVIGEKFNEVYSLLNISKLVEKQQYDICIASNRTKISWNIFPLQQEDCIFYLLQGTCSSEADIKERKYSTRNPPGKYAVQCLLDG